MEHSLQRAICHLLSVRRCKGFQIKAEDAFPVKDGCERSGVKKAKQRRIFWEGGLIA